MTQDGKYTRCYEVTFPGDGIKDHMLLEKVTDAFETYQGRFKEERGGTVPVAFNDPDRDDGETEAGVSIIHIYINRVGNIILYQYYIDLKFSSKIILSFVGCISQLTCSYMLQIFD